MLSAHASWNKPESRFARAPMAWRAPIRRDRRNLAIVFEPTPANEPRPMDLALERTDRALRRRHRDLIDQAKDDFWTHRDSIQNLGARLASGADLAIRIALAQALAHTAEHLGDPPGVCAIFGLGKLGAGEMRPQSDIDLLFVYEAWSADLAASAMGFFDRVAKTLLRSLTWSADNTPLYQADMRLRPYGEDGPVATPLSGLKAYYSAECWTWELQALTRARFLAGDEALAHNVQTSLLHALTSLPDRHFIIDQVAAMRALLEEEKPGKGYWDQKYAAGGVIDVEFIVQGLCLENAASLGAFIGRTTRQSLNDLARVGLLSGQTARFLLAAYELYTRISWAQDILQTDDLEQLANPSRRALLVALGLPSWPALRRRLDAYRGIVRSAFEELIAPVEHPERVTTRR